MLIQYMAKFAGLKLEMFECKNVTHCQIVHCFKTLTMQYYGENIL